MKKKMTIMTERTTKRSTSNFNTNMDQIQNMTFPKVYLMIWTKKTTTKIDMIFIIVTLHMSTLHKICMGVHSDLLHPYHSL